MRGAQKEEEDEDGVQNVAHLIQKKKGRRNGEARAAKAKLTPEARTQLTLPSGTSLYAREGRTTTTSVLDVGERVSAHQQRESFANFARGGQRWMGVIICRSLSHDNTYPIVDMHSR